MSPPPTVRVNRKAAARLASGHPWVFANDVLDHGNAAGGDAVTVVDPRGRVLGTAHYSSLSQICLRLLCDRPVAVDQEFLHLRLEAAAAYRRRIVSGSEAYRVVFGEADRLPGLIVDRYGDYLVVQALDQGMDRLLPEIVACLEAMFAPKGVVARNDVSVRNKEGLPLEVRLLSGGVPETVCVNINGLAFHADLLGGQKTGIFLDQRENYLAAARYARGRALDCFTSAGGFALHLAARCEAVEAVDRSAAALRIAERNRAANGIANVEFREADVFDLLAGYAAAGRRWDIIVLDPPAFAKSKSSLEGALRGYREINLRALKMLDSGGVLVTCSCSHHASEAMLLEAVARAALDAGRALRVLERRTQSLDHPILLTVPETHYLKCLILEVL